MNEHYIEIHLQDQIDRYHILDISVDQFLDTINPILKKGFKVNAITKHEFDKAKPKTLIILNVEDDFEVHHYVFKHRNAKEKKEWNRFLKTLEQ